MLPPLSVLLLVSHISASVLPRTKEASPETFQQHLGLPSHLAAFLTSRSPLQVFTLSGTGKLASPLGIEHHGIANIIENEHRPIDNFILNGNTLLADNRDGACYVNPETARLQCENIPEGVPRLATVFGLAENGTLVYNGTANWLACPAQNPGTYQVYSPSMRISPYCILTQLQSGEPQKKKRSSFSSSIHEGHAEEASIIATRGPKSCAFHLQVLAVDGFESFDNESLKHITFYWLGKRLGAGPNGLLYCFIKSSTRELDCAGKESPDLVENFHSIDFSINEKGNLMHSESDIWVACKTSQGWTGPYDDKKTSDPECRATQIHLRVQTLAGYDCRSNLAKRDSRTTSELSLRGTATPPTPKCPTSLEDTLFRSPVLLVPVSSINRTLVLGNTKYITVSPTQNMLFNFVIPYTKPYYNKTCALLLLLPKIESLNVEYEAVAPALKFSELEKPVDGQTTWENMPKARSMISKTMPNEIKPGKSNFITTLPCDSGSVKAFMISTQGGLSMVVHQEGVPNESGLHLVPCV